MLRNALIRLRTYQIQYWKQIHDRVKKMWGSSWGTSTQKQLQNDALNLMFAGRPSQIGPSWESYFPNAEMALLGVASLMKHPYFGVLVYSMSPARREHVVKDLSQKISTLAAQMCRVRVATVKKYYTNREHSISKWKLDSVSSWKRK